MVSPPARWEQDPAGGEPPVLECWIRLLPFVSLRATTPPLPFQLLHRTKQGTLSVATTAGHFQALEARTRWLQQSVSIPAAARHVDRRLMEKMDFCVDDAMSCCVFCT